MHATFHEYFMNISIFSPCPFLHDFQLEHRVQSRIKSADMTRRDNKDRQGHLIPLAVQIYLVVPMFFNEPNVGGYKKNTQMIFK